MSEPSVWLPSVWLVGQWLHADFAAPVQWLRDRARCDYFDSPMEALTAATHGSHPRAVLLMQPRPGQISHSDVQRLHAKVPLARLAALIGPWCEGELRSGRPWPGVIRVPWRAWQSRLGSALGLSGDLPHWPRTASDAERIEQSVKSLTPVRLAGATAVICTDCRAAYESTADALKQLGIASLWRQTASTEQVASADWMIVDGWQQLEENAAATQPRLLLLHFPRTEDQVRAATAGIAAIVALPLLLADLAVTLDDLIGFRPLV